MLDTIRQLLFKATPAPSMPPATHPGAVVSGRRIQARAHEAASTRAPRGSEWSTADPPANVATMDAARIRARCRASMRNDAYARAIVETFVDDVIGWGVKPLSRARHEPFRQALQQLHEDWAAFADADGVLDFYGLQALAVRNLVVDGECFIRLRRRKPEDGLPVPLQLQVLPAEICPETESRDLAGGAKIRQGIEYDAIGRRVAYWMLDTPPGEDTFTASVGTPHRVPADQVCHLFDPQRPGQRRGVSMVAPALVRLMELDKFSDATLKRLQLSNMVVATIKRPAGIDDVDPMTGAPRDTADTGEPPVVRLESGLLQELEPGEELEISEPPDPPASYEAYVNHELRGAGAAVGVPLEAFTSNWGSMNDRIARVVLNQYRRRVQRFLWSIVVPQLLQPVWQAWFALALPLVPAVTGAAEEDVKGRVTFAPHAWPYIHPVQDVQSDQAAIRNGFTSRSTVVSARGEDVEVIDAQIAADNVRADRLKLQLDSDPRQTTKGGAR